MTRRRAGLCLAAVTCVLLATAPPASAAETLADYASRVSRARHIVDGATPDMGGERTAHDVAAEVNTLLPSVETVLVGDREVSVDNSIVRSLVASLDSAPRPEGRRRAGSQLKRHLASLEHAVGDGRLEPVPFDRAALDRLLAKQRAEGRDSLTRQVQEWVDRAVEWVVERMRGGSERTGASTAMNVTFYVVLALLTLAVVFAAWRVWRGIRVALASRERAREAEEAESLPVVSAAEGLPADPLRFADDLAAEGRFREAVRALFGGAARTLVERGLVRQARTRTNGELLADARPAAPDAEPHLRELSAAFEAAWYGHIEPDEQGFAAARELYRAALAAMPKREVAA